MKTVDPSRRKILAVAAAAPLAALPLAVPALAGAIAPDPNFAALDACRRAKASFDKVRASIREVLGDLPEPHAHFIFIAKADGDSEKVSNINHLNTWLDRQGPAHGVACKRVFAEAAARVLGIEEPDVADPSPESLAAWEAERAAIVAEFESARRTYDEIQQEAGLPGLWATSEKAAEVLNAAEAEVLATVPTTPAGGAALMRYCLDETGRYDNFEDVMPAMQNALAAVESAIAA
jgi:hypothetical protein